MGRKAWLAVLAVALAGGWAGDARGQLPPPLPLHAQIDALVEAAAIGPLNSRCSDADFVRRVYLDLTGVIPTADQARKFVADRAADKREQLIDALIGSQDFLRHLTVTLDVFLMERKPEKAVKQAEWERFLYDSLAANKPLDRLFQELIATDGGDDALRPAARFSLDRDAEPNLMTRDIGRLAFGMDLACCQCHDHPLIDDYYQEDYYGLFAFVSRTSLFTDAKSKLVSLGEKADGEASFKSVFTGAASDRAQPRLPKGQLVFSEPAFASGTEYKVKPDKTVRGVPRYSRRATLAQMLPGSREFAVNLANRLWAQMLGRGIVHPLDFHHAANPPSNPALLTLLANEFARPRSYSGEAFQMGPLLREIARTRAYQRSCDEPRVETINFVDVAARLAAITTELDLQKKSLEPLDNALSSSFTAFKLARDQQLRITSEISKLDQEIAAAKAEGAKLALQRSARADAAKLAEGQLEALRDAAEALQQLVVAAPEISSLTASAQAIRDQVRDLTAQLQRATAQAAQPTTEESAVEMRLSSAESAKAACAKELPPLAALAAREQAYLEARQRRDEARAVIKALEARKLLAQDLVTYQTLAAAGDDKAPALWASIVERWSIAGQVALLKPLTPEQLAVSVMQATGALPPPRPDSSAEGNSSEPTKPTTSAALESLDKLRPVVREFVRHYGGQPGEEYQATVNQALFFGNGNYLESWLKSSDNNLLARLNKLRDTNKLGDTSQLADELYWSVFSRAASAEERQTVESYLNDRDELKDQDERSSALVEIAWALLSSGEFRFNH